MRVLIAAVGKGRDSPERALYTQYATRLPWKITLKECEAKKTLPVPARIAEEEKLLLAAAQGFTRRVVLDERGKTLSSRELADQLGRWQVEGESGIAFIIGGADGVTDAMRRDAHLLLSFGRASWPHMLVRAMLAEQLYRAHTLITGHPYHRD